MNHDSLNSLIDHFRAQGLSELEAETEALCALADMDRPAKSQASVEGQLVLGNELGEAYDPRTSDWGGL